MNGAIVHRGHDDQGSILLGEAGLAMRRLSIIDLSGGHQPIANEDSTVWVVFNGEIYNHRELRQGLAERGHRFRTASDTEVIVHLYEEKGERAVENLRGMFAFAIWDTRRRKLLLARDRFGQKPLFWRFDGRRFLFGSEIKSILAVTPAPGIDLRSLDEYLTLRFIPSPRTMFAGPGWSTQLMRDAGRARLSALTTGSTCTASPTALIITMAIFFPARSAGFTSRAHG